MVLYEVNAEISKDLSQAYLDWLKPHIELILKEPGFLSAEVFQENEVVASDKEKFVVHYFVNTEEDLKNYFAGPAKAYRQEALQKFGPSLSISRRQLTKRYGLPIGSST